MSKSKKITTDVNNLWHPKATICDTIPKNEAVIKIMSVVNPLIDKSYVSFLFLMIIITRK